MANQAREIRLVILDRDGVINQDSANYIKDADEWLPLDGSIEAIATLTRAGYRIAVATNQSGLARGLYNEAALQRMHDKLRDMVNAAGGNIDIVAVCPHGPNDGCDCRKPAPGLLIQIADYWQQDLVGVPFIGDTLRDLEAAAAAGAEPVLVRTGNGAQTERALPERFHNIAVFDDLAAAAAHFAAT